MEGEKCEQYVVEKHYRMIMNIIRKYKLHRLGIIVDDLCLRVIKFIESNVLNLTEVNDPHYPNHIFYMKDDKCYLQYNIKNQYLYVRYDGIWDVFYNQFNLEDSEIEQIMKDVFEEHYKLKVETTDISCGLYSKWFEEHCKLKIKQPV